MTAVAEPAEDDALDDLMAGFAVATTPVAPVAPVEAGAVVEAEAVVEGEAQAGGAVEEVEALESVTVDEIVDVEAGGVEVFAVDAAIEAGTVEELADVEAGTVEAGSVENVAVVGAVESGTVEKVAVVEAVQSETIEKAAAVDVAGAGTVEEVAAVEPETTEKAGTAESGSDGRLPKPSRWLSLASGRLPLIAIMLLQVILAYQLSNTAFEDESLYLYAGHREIALLLHGTSTYDSYPSYFSGAPFLYPVVVAWFDTMWGLEGARALSLVMMLATTGLVWTITRRLYGRAASLFAAALFATSAPTLFLSRFATYDAMTIFLLAFALWIVVRTAKAPIVSVLLAAPVLALAVAVKYAALLYVPSIIAVAILVVPISRGYVAGSVRLLWIRAVSRGAALGAAVFAFLAVALMSISQDMRTGITSTTTSRNIGSDPFSAIFQLSIVWCGWVFVLAAVAVGFEWLRRKRRGAHRGARTALASVFAGSALLATAYQAHIQKMQSLHKHIGFGLMLAAPAAGLGIAALSRMGNLDVRKRIPGLAVGICALLAFYAGHAVRPLYYGWPNSAAMVDTICPLVHDGNGRYLAEENEVPRYYLRDKTQPYEWYTTFFFQYTLKSGQSVSGLPAYQAAITDGYFNLIVLDHGPTAALDVDLDKALKASNTYRLLATVPGATGHGAQMYEIWQVR